MWSPLLEPRLTLLSGQRRDLRGFCHELAHHAVHHSDGAVLWLDGEHGCNPYDHAELNLQEGHDAEHGAQRILIRRCMTPFQWDGAIRRHLPAKLTETECALVLVAPFDAQFTTDETQDWEQEDLVVAALRSLTETVRKHRVPIVLTVDMTRLWHTHPNLASLLRGVPSKWTVTNQGRWRLESNGTVLDPGLPGQRTLMDLQPVVVSPRPPRRT